MRLDPSLLAARVARIRAARAWHLGVLDPAADDLPEPGAEAPREPEPCAKCGSVERYRSGGGFGQCVPCKREAARRQQLTRKRKLAQVTP